ncbi:hypothetical protein K470DRAFT_269067 [Piedraia hortae CBS 480.64]|uniref:Uncharacterized protein n=1 Tax=Piedraia hortae CBS 480.64 TaxID=1314780 RepID=A0A6A7C619_9PEZI|nr:hypothetical protein K470DRAFT_269067 [Piedraia hortae CBS 480.64]
MSRLIRIFTRAPANPPNDRIELRSMTGTHPSLPNSQNQLTRACSGNGTFTTIPLFEADRQYEFPPNVRKKKRTFMWFLLAFLPPLLILMGIVVLGWVLVGLI